MNDELRAPTDLEDAVPVGPAGRRGDGSGDDDGLCSSAELVESRALAEIHGGVAHLANLASDVDEAVSLCLELVATTNAWDFGHAYFPVSGERGALEVTDSYYCREPERFLKFREALRGTRLQVGEGLPGRVFKTGRAEWSHDVAGELDRRRASVAEDLAIKTVTAFPIVVDRSVKGVLEFFSGERIEVDRRLKDSMAAVGISLGRVLERSEARQRLAESEGTLRELTEHLRDAVWLRESGTLATIYCNSVFEEFFACDGSALEREPRCFLEVVHPEDRGRVEHALARLAEGEEMHQIYRVRRPDGSWRWLRERGYPLRGIDGAVDRLVGAAEDVSRRREAEEEMRRMEHEIRNVAERERCRIAREFHDSVGSRLSVVDMRLQMLGEDLAAGRKVGLEEVGELSEIIRKTITRARSLIRGLSPVGEEPGDLMAALARLAAEAGGDRRMDCRFECRQEINLTSREVANELYRIAQEAVHNAIRHSGASALWVSLHRHDGDIILSVRDDGSGFDPEAAGSGKGGLGLQIMNHRAASINAALHIAPARDGGTLVACALPEDRAGLLTTEADR